MMMMMMIDDLDCDYAFGSSEGKKPTKLDNKFDEKILTDEEGYRNNNGRLKSTTTSTALTASGGKRLNRLRHFRLFQIVKSRSSVSMNKSAKDTSTLNVADEYETSQTNNTTTSSKSMKKNISRSFNNLILGIRSSSIFRSTSSSAAAAAANRAAPSSNQPTNEQATSKTGESASTTSSSKLKASSLSNLCSANIFDKKKINVKKKKQEERNEMNKLKMNKKLTLSNSLYSTIKLADIKLDYHDNDDHHAQVSFNFF